MTLVNGSPGETQTSTVVISPYGSEAALGHSAVPILSSPMNGIDSVVTREVPAQGKSTDTKVQSRQVGDEPSGEVGGAGDTGSILRQRSSFPFCCEHTTKFNGSWV